MFSDISKIPYLDQKTAGQIDQELMNKYHFSLQSLMELAGLSCAHAIYNVNEKYYNSKIKKIIVIIGPGNNGGDGYVAARHLKLLGFNPSLLLVKKPEKQLFVDLLDTCIANEIESFELDNLSKNIELFLKEYDLLIDSLFGFSFKGPVKKPYDTVLDGMKNSGIDIFSIDIPSGWDVELGNINNTFIPKFLISLTLPKLGVKNFNGKHYLGGRFVPIAMVKENGWNLSMYSGLNQFVELN